MTKQGALVFGKAPARHNDWAANANCIVGYDNFLNVYGVCIAF